MNDRLSQIETLWSVVRRAHGTQDNSTRLAQEQMVERYGSAIKNYLLAAMEKYGCGR